jgi:sorting nexin-8
MSLFGSSPDEPARPQSKSLFDDEPTPGTTSNASLFADDTATGDSSPWGMPTPKKAAPNELVKSLLPASDAPESYIDAYDAVLNTGERTGSGLSLTAVSKILQSTKISSSEQARILQLVAPTGTESTGLGRSEFNVLLALIGLSQEGEEATLDGVDERRKSTVSSFTCD